MNAALPRILGYARVSTQGQDLAYQLERLRKAGCVRIYREKRSGKSCGNRSELHALLTALRPGDLLLATSTDRVARDPLDLLNILHAVKKAGAGLRLVDEPFIDTTSELADLIAFIVGWAARWHRLRILENTAHGREQARKRGVKFGRKPKLDAQQRLTVMRRHAKGETYAELADVYGVSASTILRACH